MDKPMRHATVKRTTKETKISASVNLDGTGIYNVSTGIGFLDHMLEQLSRHSLIDLEIVADGDLKKKTIEIDDVSGFKSVILDNNPKIGEVAAGSYDKNFNPHSQYDTDPAYNFDPGANNQVHAVAALFDDFDVELSSLSVVDLSQVGVVA